MTNGRLDVRRVLASLTILGLAHGMFGQPALQAQGSSQGSERGWFGTGASSIAVVRPSTMVWYLTTAFGDCPVGFSPMHNSDGTTICSAQFGLGNNVDSVIADFRTGFGRTSAAVLRRAESRLYFQPANAICPVGSSPAGRLASGALYCYKNTVVGPSMMPLTWTVYGLSEVAAWDPATATFIFPRVGGGCPRGTRAFGSACTLRWGNPQVRTVPRLLDIDRDGVDDIGFYDPNTASHFYIPSRGSCPPQTLPNGTVNGVASCRMLPATGQVAVLPGDYDGDGYADVINYDVIRHVFTLIPSSRACPFAFRGAGRDTYGREQCTITLGDSAMDAAVPGGDFDGDGRVDPVVVNESTYVWFLSPSSGVCPATTTPRAGAAGIECFRQLGLPPDRAIR